jgi:hypothetical protein
MNRAGRALDHSSVSRVHETALLRAKPRLFDRDLVDLGLDLADRLFERALVLPPWPETPQGRQSFGDSVRRDGRIITVCGECYTPATEMMEKILEGSLSTSRFPTFSPS